MQQLAQADLTTLGAGSILMTPEPRARVDTRFGDRLVFKRRDLAGRFSDKPPPPASTGCGSSFDLFQLMGRVLPLLKCVRFSKSFG